jgi:glycosyltransferase involved in cell wall biosynthesis
MDPVAKIAKPDMCAAGHVLVITSEFYRVSAGGAVVMRNLLTQFSPESFTVLTRDYPAEISAPISPEIRVLTVRTDPPFTRRGERFWRDLAHPFIERRIKKLVRQVRPALILAVYPSLHIFSAAINAAETNGIPWVAYLLDVLAEPYHGTKYEQLAEDVQRRMFSSADAILVTGRGMADLYRAKHSVECVRIEIGYCEPIAATLKPPPAGAPHAFMGGSIYAVNDKAVARLLKGAEQAGIGFRLATPGGWTFLDKCGIARRPGIEKAHYLVRKDYLAALLNQHILTVGLNWPDESSTPEDELATAFPTKVVEYLAAGQPILVHCPENYFLARFFREHECGIIVSTREVAAIAAAVRTLLDDGPEQDRMRKNALRAAQIFSIDRLSMLLRQTLDDIFRLKRIRNIQLQPNSAASACGSGK